jgi:hypothetical protein
MNKNVFSILFLTIHLFLYSPSIIPQDTFSIVAVDTITGEIGSAGASCVGPYGGVGAFILSDVMKVLVQFIRKLFGYLKTSNMLIL